MRYLFVLLLLVGCARPYGGNCDEVDGLEVTDIYYVPNGYTGVAFVCVDGKVQQLMNLNDGLSEGVQRAWHENGQLGSELNFKDGKRDGNWRYWYENGQLIFEHNYKAGKIIDDKVVYYKEDGTIKGTAYYKNGEQVSCEGNCE